MLFGSLVLICIALFVCVLLTTQFLGLVSHVTTDQVVELDSHHLFLFPSSTALQDSFAFPNVCLILYFAPFVVSVALSLFLTGGVRCWRLAMPFGSTLA